MEENKQIEEMAKDFRIAHTNVIIGNRYYENVAKNFYNLNYRKIPKDAVVLTKEEYERLKARIDVAESKLRTIDYTRKETAREIFDKIFALHGNRADIMYFEIEELAKQYGVEMED